jgi:hypothetical protein
MITPKLFSLEYPLAVLYGSMVSCRKNSYDKKVRAKILSHFLQGTILGWILAIDETTVTAKFFKINL